MTYLGELRRHWRYLAAASLGLAAGFTLNLYVANVFAPHLLHEFGWSRSQFALLGVSILLGVIVLPVVGRITDILGVRRLVAAGVIMTPLVYIAYSMIGPSFTAFFALNLAHVVTGAVTTSLVYSRLIAESFQRARGIALAIAACAAPAAGAVAAPVLAGFIEVYGWRAAYLALAAATAIAGTLALVLIPRKDAPVRRSAAEAPSLRDTAGAYREIFRSRPFRKIAAGMLFCNLTMMVQSSQLGLIVIERGVTPTMAATMLSIYAAGIVAGRLICGLALDRYPTHVVAAVSLGLPAIGLLLLASGATATAVLALGVLIVGLSMGAELDVLAYLVMRYFRVDVYSTVYGLIQPVISISAASGSILLSVTLGVSGGFSLFLYLAAFSTVIGAAFFMLLARETRPGPQPQTSQAG